MAPHGGRAIAGAVMMIVALMLLPLSAAATPLSQPGEGPIEYLDGGDKSNKDGEKSNKGGENSGNGQGGENPGNGQGGENPGNGRGGENPGNGRGGEGSNKDGDKSNGGGENSGNGQDGEKSGNGQGGEKPNKGGEKPDGGGGLGPPSIVPSGVGPTEGGPRSNGAKPLSPHIGAAIVLFDPAGIEVVSQAQHSSLSTSAISSSIVGFLAPVLPVGLPEMAAAPILVFEALFEAMKSSGQALVIPLLAATAGIFAPSRHRDLLAEALGEDAGS